jgi:hypothetical protein
MQRKVGPIAIAIGFGRSGLRAAPARSSFAIPLRIAPRSSATPSTIATKETK